MPMMNPMLSTMADLQGSPMLNMSSEQILGQIEPVAMDMPVNALAQSQGNPGAMIPAQGGMMAPQPSAAEAIMGALGQVADVIDEQNLISQLTTEDYLKYQNLKQTKQLEDQKRILDSLALEADIKYRQEDLQVRKEHYANERLLLQAQLAGINLQNMASIREFGKGPGQAKFEESLASANAQKAAEIIAMKPDFDSFDQTLADAETAAKAVDGWKTLPLIKGGMTAAGDPELNNMASTLADLATRMRTVVKMPASGFSDADAARLDRMVGGQEPMNKDVILDIIGRLKNQAAVTKQSQARLLQGIGSNYNVDTAVPGSIANPGSPVVSGGVVDVATEAEAEALPPGTRFRLNGRTGTVQ